MNIIAVIVILLLIGTTFYFYKQSKIQVEYNANIIKNNEKALELHEHLTNLNDALAKENIQLEADNKILHSEHESYQIALAAKTEVAKNAFEQYCETLSKKYDEIEKEYDENTLLCIKAYEQLHQQYLEQKQKESDELEKIHQTRKAAMEALLREEEIKEQLDFYRLKPSEKDINDIAILNSIKTQLNTPRILSMLIWSNFFQKDMTALCNRVLGTSQVSGIYKITNQTNNKCYIGQSVDVGKRWKDHAKCGLGIDTPAGNKLYKAMQTDGIWNFSWELLEACPREELDKEERYFIEIYQSESFGYNSTKGNK